MKTRLTLCDVKDKMEKTSLSALINKIAMVVVVEEDINIVLFAFHHSTKQQHHAKVIHIATHYKKTGVLDSRPSRHKRHTIPLHLQMFWPNNAASCFILHHSRA